MHSSNSPSKKFLNVNIRQIQKIIFVNYEKAEKLISQYKMMEEEDANPFVNMLLQHNEPKNVNLIVQNSTENYQNIEFMGDHHTSKNLIFHQ